MATEPVMRKLPRYFSLATMAIALFCLFGWITNNILLTSFGKNMIMMAPSTGLSFIMLSVVLLRLTSKSPFTVTWKILTQILLWTTLLYCLYTISSFIAGTDSFLDKLLSGTDDKMGDIIIGRMSPITAALFLLATWRATAAASRTPTRPIAISRTKIVVPGI